MSGYDFSAEPSYRSIIILGIVFLLGAGAAIGYFLGMFG
jgi:hypothetical protein